MIQTPSIWTLVEIPNFPPGGIEDVNKIIIEFGGLVKVRKVRVITCEGKKHNVALS